MSHPHNVEAIRQWLRDLGGGRETHGENLAYFDALLEADRLGNAKAQAILAVALQGFEAGRRFQAEHPGVPLGGGSHYLADTPLAPPVHATALLEAARVAADALRDELLAAGADDVALDPTLNRHAQALDALEGVLARIAAQGGTHE